MTAVVKSYQLVGTDEIVYEYDDGSFTHDNWPLIETKVRIMIESGDLKECPLDVC